MAAQPPPGDAGPKATVFISYSRTDMAFADRLETALKARGFDPLIDRTEIYAFEDWWKRIEVLIGRADTVIYVLSPDAVRSEVARKEIAYAASLNKRFAPIVCRRVDGGAVPEPLRRLNFIFFDDPERFEASADLLAEALETDIGWVRQHTEFGALAQRWVAAGRPGPKGLLLRPPVLDEAERWIAARPRGAPVPTAETRQFIVASRRAANRRRNAVTSGLAAGLVVALALAAVAFWQRRLAVQARNTAIAAQARVTANRALSIAQSDPGSALALALETVSLPDYGAPLPYEPSAELALATAAYGTREVKIFANATVFNETVDEARLNNDADFRAGFMPDGQAALTLSSDGNLRRWDVATGRALSTLRVAPIDDEMKSADLLIAANGRRVAVQIWTNGKTYAPRLIDPQTGRQIASLGDDKTFVDAIAMSPDGDLIAAARADRTVRIWNADDGTDVRTFAQDDEPTCVAFSPDKRSIAICAGTALRIFDLATGAEKIAVDLGESAGFGTRVAFNADGSQLASVSTGTVRVWATATGARISAIDVKERVTRILFVPGSSWLLVVHGETAELFDAGNGRSVQATNLSPASTGAGDAEERRVSSAAVSRDGTELAIGAQDGTVALWTIDPPHGAVDAIARLRGHQGRVVDVSFAPKGHVLLTASLDGTARLWTSDRSPFRRDFPSGQSAALTPDGDTLIIAAGRKLSFWNAETGEKSDEGDVQTDWLALSRDGKKLAFPVPGNEIAISYDGQKSPCDVLQGHTGKVSAGFFAPEGLHFWTVADDRTVRLWDLSSCNELKTIWRAQGRFPKARLSPDGRMIAISDADTRDIHILDAMTGAPVSTVKSEIKGTYTFDFSARSDRLLTASGQGPVHIWDPRTGTLVMSLPHNAADMAIWSPRGDRILTGGLMQPAKLWDARTGELLRVLTGHIFGADRAAFSPDGRHVATASMGGFKLIGGPILIWDADTGDQIARLAGSERGIESIAFSADGKRILAQGGSGTTLWTWFPGLSGLLDYSLRTAPRCLTLEQREKLFLTPAPPAWCIELGKWPFDTPEWRAWLADTKAGRHEPMPVTSGSLAHHVDRQP